MVLRECRSILGFMLLCVPLLVGSSTALAAVRIHEFMASNGVTVADEDGDYEDWIELHNPGDLEVSLAGWGLSDDPGDPFKWTFPDGSWIGSGEYMLVWASGKNRPGAKQELLPPDELDGLVLWLHADGLVSADGASVDTWTDASGRGNHATQGTATQRPAFVANAVNGLPALRFQRSAAQQLFLPTSNFDGLSDFSDFSLVAMARWTGGVRSGLFGGYRGSNLSNVGSSVFEIVDTGGGLRLRLPPGIDMSAANAVTLNQWHLIGASMDSNAATARIFRDGAVIGEAGGLVGTTSLANYERVPVGSSHDDTRTFGGEIAEIVLYNRSLTAPERMAVERYLAIKYGLPIASEPLLPHTNFRIAAQGESLVLTRPDGTTADAIGPVSLPRDISYGRTEADPNIWAYFYQPTPGAANTSTPFAKLIPPVAMSHPAGFYEGTIELSLSHPDPDTVILYTLDGSEPDFDHLNGTTYTYLNSYPNGPFLTHTYNTAIYNGPIPIVDRSSLPDKLTQISTTGDSNPAYFPVSPVKKATIVRARAYKDGAAGAVTTATYFVSATDAFAYDLPVVSLAVSEPDLFDFWQGIYVAGVDRVTQSGTRICDWGNYNRRGAEGERAVHFQFFNPDQTLGVNHEAGIRIQGNCSRGLPFKSLRLYGRDTGDAGDAFDFPFFPELVPGARHAENSLYQRLILRAPNINDTAFSRLFQSVYEGVGGRVQPVVQFINGEFWGIAFLRDRFDPQHLHHHYGLDPDNITIIVIRYRHEVEGTPPSFGNRVYAVSSGLPSDLEAFHQMREFIIQNNMANPASYAGAQERLCIDSFIDHLILKIFAGDDHYAPEFIFWRARHAEDDHFGDGRWRVFVKDFDSTLRTDNYVTGLATGTHPRPFGYELFASLLDNASFRTRFINRFADLLNTQFLPGRFQEIIDRSYAEVAPYWAEVAARWNNAAISNPHRPFTATHRQNLINWSQQHPARQRSHIRNHFGISAECRLTARVSDPAHGYVRVNTVEIRPGTPGLSSSPYPWSGTYFANVPVELEAIPQAGYRFVGWIVWPTATPPTGEPVYDSTEAAVTLIMDQHTTAQAVFESVPFRDFPVALHVWEFEDLDALLEPVFSISTGRLAIEPTEPGNVTAGTGADFPTQHLRVNDPLGKTVTFTIPTTGYEAVQIDFLTRRSAQGPAQQTWSFTIDGQTWIDIASYTVHNDTPQARTLDFSNVPGASDNPNFAVRVAFAQTAFQIVEGSGLGGNNRFDDVIISGVALPSTNIPPRILEDAPAFVEAVVGQPFVLYVGMWFADPDGDPLTFSATADDGTVLSAQINDGELTLTPLAAGGTTVTVSANDGTNPPVPHSVDVLVYGAPFALADGTFVFDEWDPYEPAGSFPNHMIFLQSAVTDPDLAEPVPSPYSIAGDANTNDDPGFPYAAQSRTRINGLGADGISWINTGRGRDLGAAVLSLDTTGQSNIRVSWTAGTLLPNSRVYGLRLQYRAGLDGSWIDVAANGQPVEYVRNELAGHAAWIGPVPLPTVAEGLPLVQLRWKYHHISGTSGPRAMLRLDDIVVTAGVPAQATQLAFAPLAFRGAQSAVPPGTLEVRAHDGAGAFDTQFNGTVTLSLVGDGALGGTLSAVAHAGIAVFHNWFVTGPDGSFELFATAPGLAPARSGTLFLSTLPVFLPPGSADWTDDMNWTGAVYPRSAGAGAMVPSAFAADRDVNLQAPVSIGMLRVDNADSPHRNRIRDRSFGNTLTFDGAGSEAVLHINGLGTGLVELANEAGTILATNLRLIVNNTAGDPDHGALRLRESWTGPGSIIKDGPGMASLTGADKNFSGPIRVERGVLAFTEPAVAGNASGVTVLPGAQLRFVSGSNATEPLRLHTFGGTFSLAGTGWADGVDSAGRGVLGALRYDPDGQGNRAELTNPITFADDAGLHVDGRHNRFDLSGSLAGAGDLLKSGGGTLILSGSANAHTGRLIVDNGTLVVNTAHPSPVTLSADGVLSGHGSVGAISGAGTVTVQGGVLTAPTLDGPAVVALFDQPDAAGNGVLRLTAATPIVQTPATLDLLVRASGVVPGDRMRGGIFTPAHFDLATALSATTVRIHVPDPAGTFEHDGITYRPASDEDALSSRIVAESVPFQDGTVQGHWIEILRTGAPATFAQWVGLEIADPVLRADPSFAGPEADPTLSGLPNLLRYAFGLGLTQPPSARLPSIESGPDGLLFRFPVDLGLEDITYRVRSSVDLLDWSTVLYDSRLDAALLPTDGWLWLPLDPEFDQVFIQLHVVGPHL
jgi:autotransporter-associated beta strand protein